jgi:hypothetical protein
MRLADAVDSAACADSPPVERARRERAALRYLERLADGQAEARIRLGRERFRG